MIIQKLFWEPVVFHSMNMLEPLVSYVHNLSYKGVTWSSSKISSFLLWLRRVDLAGRRQYFISAVLSQFLFCFRFLKWSRQITRTWRILIVSDWCYGVVLYKASHVVTTIFRSIVLPRWVLIINGSSTRERSLLWLPQRHPVSKRGETCREMMNFAHQYLCYTSRYL
jgi:hypothetical protein